jgi:hypothetical protein
MMLTALTIFCDCSSLLDSQAGTITRELNSGTCEGKFDRPNFLSHYCPKK